MFDENRIMVVVKKPGECPCIDISFENNLTAFQEAVGGPIECIRLSNREVLICHEEGRLLDLPYNITIGSEPIVGPVVVAGIRDDEFVSLSGARIMQIARRLNNPVNKWNWKTRQYEPYILPFGNVKLRCDSLEEVINCAACGSALACRNSLVSMEIHTEMGLGYLVCEKCFRKEWARRAEADK